MQTVTDSYLIGIREGRSLLRSIQARGETVTRQDMEAFAANCSAQLCRGFARELSDVFRGELDFWRNQIRNAAA